MAFTLPVAQMVSALKESVEVSVVSFGELVSYKFHATGKSKSFRAARVKLREEELVGDLKQGDCRFVILPDDLGQMPAKYDTILGADGLTYSLVSYLATDRRFNGQLIAYVPIGRA